ncbi:MAG: hypothetical protein GYB65_02605 [Chloroflexi bacterium]|nr:hypothetical protein [Chloroflexota bacterium]
MKRKLTYLIVLLTLIVAAAPLAVPASAQGPADFSYSFPGLEPQGWYDAASPYLTMLDMATPLLGFNADGTSNTMSFAGTAQCLDNDPECLNAGLNGQPFIIFLDGASWTGTLAEEWNAEQGQTLIFGGPLIGTLRIGDRELGPIQMQSRARLQCANGDCTALTFQAMACGAAGDHQFGMVIVGGLFGSDGGVGETKDLEAEDRLGLRWQDLGANAALSAPGMVNPICSGGRTSDAVFAEEYTPEFDLPRRSAADVDGFDLPQGETGRVDRRVLIDFTSLGVNGETSTVNVRGFFYGQCGVEPRVRSRINEDGIPEIMIFRVVPDDVTCDGGLEAFAFEVTFGAPLMCEENPYIIVNGQNLQGCAVTTG